MDSIFKNNNSLFGKDFFSNNNTNANNNFSLFGNINNNQDKNDNKQGGLFEFGDVSLFSSNNKSNSKFSLLSLNNNKDKKGLFDNDSDINFLGFNNEKNIKKDDKRGEETKENTDDITGFLKNKNINNTNNINIINNNSLNLKKEISFGPIKNGNDEQIFNNNSNKNNNILENSNNNIINTNLNNDDSNAHQEDNNSHNEVRKEEEVGRNIKMSEELNKPDELGSYNNDNDYIRLITNPRMRPVSS